MTPRHAARLALVDRIRVVEYRLARADHARAAADLVGDHGHALGNAIQVVDLASLELVRQARGVVPRVIADLRVAAERASAALTAMMASTCAARRTELGPAVTPAIRAAVALAQPAAAAPIELRAELLDDVASRLAADELEVLVLACALDAADASQLAFLLRERTIRSQRWIELVRIDDPADDLVAAFAPPSWLAPVDELARQIGGELTVSAGRSGRELVFAWPVAPQSSSSS